MLGLGSKTILAAFGELHPSLTSDASTLPRRAGRRRDLSRRDPHPSLERWWTRSAYAPPALQPVTRDFAFIVPADLAAAEPRSGDPRGGQERQSPASACSTGSRRHDGLSLAFEVTLQPTEKSFTDEQIAEISNRIVAAAEKLGARLRELISERVDRGVNAAFDLDA